MNTLISRLKLNSILETRGLTLIEILITLALLGIILVPFFSFYFFGTNTYEAAEKKSNIQNDVLLAAEFITPTSIHSSMYFEAVSLSSSAAKDSSERLSVRL